MTDLVFWLVLIVVLEFGDLMFLGIWVCDLGCSVVSSGDFGVGFLRDGLMGLMFRVSSTWLLMDFPGFGFGSLPVF